MSSSRFDSNTFDPARSDSGVFVLDPEDRALLKACADAWSAEEGEEADQHRRWLEAARDLPAVRLERVLRIKRMIAEGTYETADKLDATVARLLDTLERRQP